MPHKIVFSYKLDDHVNPPEVVSNLDEVFKQVKQRIAWADENNVDDRFFNIAITPVTAPVESTEVKNSHEVEHESSPDHGVSTVYHASTEQHNVPPAEVVQPVDLQPMQVDDTVRPIDSTTGMFLGPNGTQVEVVDVLAQEVVNNPADFAAQPEVVA
ncbi:MAG: hypothetical protein ORN54_00520 [Cyclobacteriaceae bacterium]|nr:hypothetical protein [Cyclobacteriaceae bacterium]